MGASSGPTRPRVLRRPQHTDDDVAETKRRHDEQLAAVSSDETEQTDGSAGQ